MLGPRAKTLNPLNRKIDVWDRVSDPVGRCEAPRLCQRHTTAALWAA
jgi:hypothetical protein